jgi:AcrR family transcriptional regulator
MTDIPVVEPELRAAALKRERYTADERRKAILKAASEVFLERGYADASIDAVVERSGGSKATVYALFGNKEGLFSAAAAECAEEFAGAIGTVNVCTSLPDSLRRIAVAYMKVVLSPKKLAMFRTMVSESARMPESGDIFFRLGPQVAQGAVAKYFRECAAARLLEADDPDELAEYFLGALRGSLFNRALFNPTRAPTDKEVERHIDFVVQTFLRGVQRPAAK